MPPGGPPNAQTTDGAQIPYSKFTSEPPDGPERIAALKELADHVNDVNLGAARRWELIVMLRVLRLRLHDVPISVAAFESLDPKTREVVRVGRLSEPSVQVLIPSFGGPPYPYHIDIDWYGDDPPHWWNSSDFSGFEAEVIAARAHLHFLETTLGLAPSGIDPSTWTWPPGTQTLDANGNPEEWHEILQNVAVPGMAVGAEHVVIEWHMGASPHDFRCDWLGATFRFWTPNPRPGRPALQ